MTVALTSRSTLLRTRRQYHHYHQHQQYYCQYRKSHSKPSSPRRTCTSSTTTSIQDFRLGRLIGTGSSGTVFRAIYLPTNTPVAVKVINKSDLCTSRRRIWYLRREIAIHRRLKKVEGVVELYDVFEDDDAVYIVMELLEGGDCYLTLKQLENKNCLHTVCGSRGVDEWTALDIIRQVLKVLVYCHDRGIAHRDLKLENIVFCKKGALKERSGKRELKVKVVDWGLACMREQDGVSGEKVGTLRYCAPEIMGGGCYKPTECDMWSVGVVLYTLLMKRCPFEGKDDKEVLREMREGCLRWDGDEVSDETKTLVGKLLNRRGGLRPKAKAALDMVVTIQRNIKGGTIDSDETVAAASCAQESLYSVSPTTATTSTKDSKQGAGQNGGMQPFDMLGMAFNRFFGGLFNGNSNKNNEVCA